jgi:hypothetical protein
MEQSVIKFLPNIDNKFNFETLRHIARNIATTKMISSELMMRFLSTYCPLGMLNTLGISNARNPYNVIYIYIYIYIYTVYIYISINVKLSRQRFGF